MKRMFYQEGVGHFLNIWGQKKHQEITTMYKASNIRAIQRKGRWGGEVYIDFFHRYGGVL